MFPCRQLKLTSLLYSSHLVLSVCTFLSLPSAKKTFHFISQKKYIKIAGSFQWEAKT